MKGWKLLLALMMVCAAATARSEPPPVRWYRAYEVREPMAELPKENLELICLVPAVPLVDKKDNVTIRNMAVLGDRSVATILFWTDRTVGTPQLRAVDTKNGKVLWQVSSPQFAGNEASQVSSVGGELTVFQTGTPGSLIRLDPQTGKSLPLFPLPPAPPQGNKRPGPIGPCGPIGIVGRLADGRFLVTGLREASDLYLGKFGAAPDRTAQLAEKAARIVQPVAMTPAGLLIALAVRDDLTSDVLAIDIAKGTEVLWRMHFAGLVAEAAVVGDSLMVRYLENNKELSKNLVLEIAMAGYGGLSVEQFPGNGAELLRLDNGKTVYSLKATRFLARVKGVDVYVQADETLHGTVFAVDAQTGKPLWRSTVEIDPTDAVAVADPTSGQVTLLLMQGDDGIRFDAATGRQTAIIKTDADQCRSVFRGWAVRVGRQWLIGNRAAVLVEKSQPQPLHAFIREAEQSFHRDRKGNPDGIESPDAKKALPALIKAMQHPRAEYRREAVGKLSDIMRMVDIEVDDGRLRPEEVRAAIPPLIKLLGDEDQEIQAMAAWDLALCGADAKSAVPALARGLQSKHPDVRLVSAAAIALIEPASEAAAAARRVLETAPPHSAVGAMPIVDGLANLKGGAPLAVARLERDLADPSRDVRERAAHAVEEVLEVTRRQDVLDPLVPALVKRLSEDPDKAVRWACADALGWIGPGAKAAAPALEKASRDGDEQLRERAKLALKQLDVHRPGSAEASRPKNPSNDAVERKPSLLP